MSRLGARWRGFARILIVALVATTSLSLVSQASAARPFTRALTDDIWFYGGPPWITRTVNTGAKLVLFEIDWASFEPTAPPPGVDPTNPAGPQYAFSWIDPVLRSFQGTGISVAFLVTDAPRWAEAPGGPEALEEQGAWRPDPTAFKAAATALARRYSGSYPDPANPGRTLPRVKYFQAWAEANFSIHLAPQWVQSGNKLVPASPEIYRGLLNAFYAGVKSVHSDNVVITEGSGPFGDSPGPCANSNYGNGCRMPPAEFARDLLCVQGRKLQPVACPDPAHFDVIAMDPYDVSSPSTHAFSADDISAPDLGKLTKIVTRAVQTGRALPRRHKPLWVTEFAYDSNPPNPGAISVATQARWMDEAFYLFWKQGASVAVWYLVRDQPGKHYSTSYYSGVYFNNGQPKPSLRAYQFPFVVWPSNGQTTIWGISPKKGTVAVQQRHGHKWKTIMQIKVAAGAVFVRQAPAGLRGSFRAVVGGEASLVWKQ
jgi:hypothetical protein